MVIERVREREPDGYRERERGMKVRQKRETMKENDG